MMETLHADALPRGATLHPCPAPPYPPVMPPRPRPLPDLHARVVVPDGRTGTVVGTRSRIVAGQANPLGYRVWLDGTERGRGHPWFLAGMLVVLDAGDALAGVG